MNSTMPPQPGRPGRDGIPLRLFAAAFMISLLVAIFSGWQSWLMHERYQELTDKRAHVTEEIGRIMLFDEILTMSVRMAAATGDSSYEKRYDRFDVQLTDAINHVRADLPQQEIAQLIADIEAANLALVKLERQAFALVHQDRRQEAMALLVSDEYMRLKEVYAGGMKKITDMLVLAIQKEQRQLHFLTDLATAANLAGVLVMLAAWVIAIWSARSWDAERREAAEALQKAHDELEDRVEQRTAELRRMNQLYNLLSQCNQAVVHSASEEELFQQVCRDAVQIGSFRMAWIGLVDEASQQIVQVASDGMGVEYLEYIQISTDASNTASQDPVGMAIREDRPFWIQDFMHDPLTAPSRELGARFGWGAKAALPLHRDGAVTGILALYSGTAHAFDEAVQKLLAEVAMDISYALDHFVAEAGRERAEARLAESERHFRATMESATDAIITATSDGNITGWNIAAERMFGYAEAEVTGKSMEMLMPERFREQHSAGLARVASGGAPHVIGKTVELAGLRKGGDEFPLELSLAQCEANEGLFFTAIIRDITERKQAEKQLRLSSDILTNISDAVYIIRTSDGIIVHATDQFEKLFGYAPGELVGKNASIVNAPTDKDPEERAKEIQAVLKVNKFWRGEVLNIRKDGVIFWSEATVTTSTFDQPNWGQVWIAVHRDISERKLALQQIERGKKEWSDAFDAVAEPIFLHDKDFRVIRANRAYAMAAGMEVKELIGRVYWEVFPKRDGPLSVCKRLIEKAEEEEEEEVALPDGTAYISRAYAIRDEQGSYAYSVHILEDVTGRKRMEEALKVLSERNQKIMESACDAIIFMNPDGAIHVWNRKAEEMFGYSAAEAIGQELHALIVPSDARARFKQAFPRFQASGEGPIIGKVIEVTALRKGGEEFPAELSVSSTQFNGRWHAIGIVRDIAERKRIEESLFLRTRITGIFATVENDEVFNEVLEVILAVMHSPLGVFGYLDKAGALVVPTMTRQVWDRCQVPGKTIRFPQEIWGDSSWARALREKRIAYSNEPSTNIPEGHVAIQRHISMPIMLRSKSIGLLQVANKERDYTPADISVLGGIAEHISPMLDAWLQREQAEAELRDSEERYRLVEENSLDAILISSSEGNIFSANPAACAMFQRTEDEICKAGRDGLVDLSDPHLPAFLEESERTGKAKGELTMTRKGGETFSVEIFSSVFTNSRGEKRTSLVVRDITERKRNQEQLILEHQNVLEINAKLEGANKQLKQAQSQLLQSEKMAAIGLLAAGVAHEINNPVGYVNSNLGTLEKYSANLLAILDKYEAAEPALGVGSPVLEEINRFKKAYILDRIRKDLGKLIAESREGLDRVKRIVLDLKSFSRADSEERWVLEDVHKMLESTLNVVWNELKYKCEITKEYAALPEINCLPQQLGQVFMNLLVNAAQAIEVRGKITLRTGQEGEMIWIEVSDTGAGISPENLPRLFEPFFTTKPVGKGTGLGLAVSYQIIEKHHGRIEVRSEPGKGTTFRVWLPVRQPGP